MAGSGGAFFRGGGRNAERARAGLGVRVFLRQMSRDTSGVVEHDRKGELSETVFTDHIYPLRGVPKTQVVSERKAEVRCYFDMLCCVGTHLWVDCRGPWVIHVAWELPASRVRNRPAAGGPGQTRAAGLRAEATAAGRLARAGDGWDPPRLPLGCSSSTHPLKPVRG